MEYYSFSESVKNGISFLYTKIFVKRARLIRLPFYVRGKKYIEFGKNITTGYRCRFEVDGTHNEKCLIIGDNVNFGDDVRISCSEKIHIGNNVLLAGKVLIVDNSHGKYKGRKQDDIEVPPNKRKIYSSPIYIKDNVWIGEGAVIQQGITIGKGSVIAANSVVTKSVPDNCIVGGVPASVLKIYDLKKREWVKYE